MANRKNRYEVRYHNMREEFDKSPSRRTIVKHQVSATSVPRALSKFHKTIEADSGLKKWDVNVLEVVIVG